VNRFQTTRWSIVLQARGATAQSRQALEELCRTYRAPVIEYIRSRSRGRPIEDVEDLGQAFFAHFLEHACHALADPARGSFRAFLLTALRNFLVDAGEQERTLKRGGNVRFQSLDSLDQSAEGTVVPDRDAPDQVFERAWAEAALRAAMRRLQAEAAAAGRSNLFDRLCEFLVERPSEADYERVAAALRMRRNTVAVAVHRLRRRLHQLMEEELADTTVDADGLSGELDQLRGSLAGMLAPVGPR